MTRIKVLGIILLFSILISSMLWGFRMITVLWTTEIYRESLLMCPAIPKYKTTLPIGDVKDEEPWLTAGFL